jgi:hypothetical protein
MKRKQYATKDKIRILRERMAIRTSRRVPSEKCLKSDLQGMREGISSDVPEVKRQEELERENSKLKKILADTLLAERVLKYLFKIMRGD